MSDQTFQLGDAVDYMGAAHVVIGVELQHPRKDPEATPELVYRVVPRGMVYIPQRAQRVLGDALQPGKAPKQPAPKKAAAKKKATDDE